MKRIYYPKPAIKVVITDKPCYICGKPSKVYEIIWGGGTKSYMSTSICAACKV